MPDDPAPTDPPVGDPPADPTPPPPPEPPADPKPPEDLSKMREALDKERSLRKDAERRAKDGDSYKAKVEEIEAASKSEAEKAADAARKEGAAEATAAGNKRLISAEARALAAQANFQDAGVAVRLLDLDDIRVADDGAVDTTEIGKRLEQLGKDNPYLLKVADDGKPRIPKPDPSQGSGRPAPTGAEKGLAEAERRYGKQKTST